MNIRHFISVCSASALLGLTLAACASGGGGDDEQTTTGSESGLTKARPSVCLYTKCAAGYHCEDPTGCVPDLCPAVKCVAGTKNVPQLGCCLPTCGGFLGTRCANGGTCVDDPTDDCDPNKGGADCGGVCVGGGPVDTAR